MLGDILEDEAIIKDFFKRSERFFLQSTKKIKDFEDVLAGIDEIHEKIKLLKASSSLSKQTKQKIAKIISRTNLVENAQKFVDEFNAFFDHIKDEKEKVEDIFGFIEKFRTTRHYLIKDKKKIFGFLSGFLEGFAQTYIFKPEFVGIIDLSKIAQEVNGVKEGAVVKVPYEALPKLIDFAYKNHLKNFVIESHNLKMLFLPDYVVKVTSSSEMIKKIDKIAKENNIKFE